MIVEFAVQSLIAAIAEHIGSALAVAAIVGLVSSHATLKALHARFDAMEKHIADAMKSLTDNVRDNGRVAARANERIDDMLSHLSRKGGSD